MNRPYRPANGRFELDRGYDPDYIPAGPTYRPNLLPSLHVEPERRPRQVTSRFNKDAGELVIFLQYAEPLVEQAAINDAIEYGKRQGTLRRIVISVAAEVYGSGASFSFLKRNGFDRNEARGYGDFIVLEKEVTDDPASLVVT